MKILTFIFTAIACLAMQNSYSQKTVKDSAYIADYNKLQALHLKELDSEVFIEYREKLREFIKKTNGKMPQPVKQPDDVLVWVKDNLEETDFMSYNEAEFEWGVINKLQEENMKQNREYLDFKIVAMKKHGVEIVTSEMRNTMSEYPEKFGLPAEMKGRLKKD